jgi:hypothetical protein
VKPLPRAVATPKATSAGASTWQDTNKAARRHFQPTRRSSPRGRPRATMIIACSGWFQAPYTTPAKDCGFSTPDPIQDAAVLGPIKAKACGGRNEASVDRPCARRLP